MGTGKLRLSSEEDECGEEQAETEGGRVEEIKGDTAG
tara:strand:+ start:271 stop:381 length:111 start_codon:yes stop_codon:yes gene_type:complete